MGTLRPGAYPGGGRSNPDRELNPNAQPKETYGSPDGEPLVYPIIGEVGTFTQKRADMRLGKDSGMVWLMHHVPFNCRGSFLLTEKYLEQLNNWLDDLAEDRTRIPQFEIGPPDEWMEEELRWEDIRVNEINEVLCYGTNKNGNQCARKAVNFSPYCQVHGGKLHPLDKIVSAERAVELPKSGDKARNDPEFQARMTRYQMFLSGMIKVTDLDDEELARGQFRGKDGKFHGKPLNKIPREMHDQFVNELFNRADVRLQEGLVECVNTMVEVATSPVYEAKDRLKAAQWVFERVRGKTPEVHVHSQDKPWEHVLQAIQGGSREESRAARGAAGPAPGGNQAFHDAFGDDEVIDGETMDIANAGIEVDFEDDGYDDEMDGPDSDGMGSSDPRNPRGRSSSLWADSPDSGRDEGGLDGSAEDQQTRGAQDEEDGLASQGPNSRYDERRSKADVEAREQYEYTSISKVDDEGNDYDMVVARPKKGSEAEAEAQRRKEYDKERRRKLRQRRAEALAEYKAKHGSAED